MTICHLFAASISGRMDEQCPAVQKAIDAVSQLWSGDRKRMLDTLQTTFGDDMLFNDIMNGWVSRDLKNATGRDRAEWLSMFS